MHQRQQSLQKYIASINMSEYMEESTNFASNPFSKAKKHPKQILLQQNVQSDLQSSNSRTINYSDAKKITKKLPKKLKAAQIQQGNLDEQVTFKNVRKQLNQILQQQSEKTVSFVKQKAVKKISLSNAILQLSQKLSQPKSKLQNPSINSQYPQTKSNKNESLIQSKKILIPSNSKVQQILNGPSLRNKFAGLLSDIHKRSISYQHQQLLKIMGIIDQTIQFSNKNRSHKTVFFEDLRRRIRDSLRIYIRLDQIEQLLYLDQKLYQLKWQYSLIKKSQDLMISLPKIQSHDDRRNHIRTIIVNFLNEKHQQFLKQNNIKQSRNASNWDEKFEPSQYEIPRKSLPIHPDIKSAEIRCFEQSKIDSIKNNNLRDLMVSKKQKSQTQSFKSASVMQMMFNKKASSKQIQSSLMQAVLKKQAQTKIACAKQSQRLCAQSQQIHPQLLKQISQNILFIFISKGVTNIFKAKLIEIIMERIFNKEKINKVVRHIDQLISLKDIGYLKEVKPAGNKPLILQINRSKAKDVIEYADKLKHTQMESQITIQIELSSNQSIKQRFI